MTENTTSVTAAFAVIGLAFASFQTGRMPHQVIVKATMAGIRLALRLTMTLRLTAAHAVVAWRRSGADIESADVLWMEWEQ